MSRPPLTRTILAIAFAGTSVAHATNGYFSHGYGVQSKGVAGAGVALAQDSLAAATNPAGLVDLGNRLDLGLDVFTPRRGAEITGNAFGPDQQFEGNETKSFYIPEFGYNRALSPSLAVGLAVYGNGGMNTDYNSNSNPYARFGATGPAGINLEQLFITPAVAWRFAEGQSVGLAVNLAYQRFEAKGISIFSGFSADPAHVSDNGTDSATGAGLRLGWQGHFGEHVALGASWQSKTRMGEFDKYAGLFADQGDFDIPETWTIGAAVKVTPKLTLLADYQHIALSDIPAVGNSVSTLFAGQPLGSDNGPGFGWDDVDVIKLGVIYQATPRLTLRAGYSDLDQPIPAGETFFNILAPGVVEKHYTIGGSFAVNEKNSVSLFVAHMPEVSVKGSNSIPPGFPPAGLGGGNANLHMEENSFGIAWQRKL